MNTPSSQLQYFSYLKFRGTMRCLFTTKFKIMCIAWDNAEQKYWSSSNLLAKDLTLPIIIYGECEMTDGRDGLNFLLLSFIFVPALQVIWDLRLQLSYYFIFCNVNQLLPVVNHPVFMAMYHNK